MAHPRAVCAVRAQRPGHRACTPPDVFLANPFSLYGGAGEIGGNRILLEWDGVPKPGYGDTKKKQCASRKSGPMTVARCVSAGP